MNNVNDILEIQGLVYRYAECLDNLDLEGFTSLFASDAIFAVFESNGTEPTLEYRGREEIAKVIGLVEIFDSTFHLVTNHRVTIDGGTARGSTYTSAHHLTSAASQIKDVNMLIRYEDVFTRSAGEWLFAERKIFRQWTVEFPAERAPMPRARQQ